MVRLKDGYGCSFDDVLKISIPYGAIKRGLLLYKSINIYEFQFLMVRLKAIKICKSFTGFSVFQFLMVRLKVSTSHQEFFQISDFNSLWCD